MLDVLTIFADTGEASLDQVHALANEMLSNDLLPVLCSNLHRLDFEVIFFLKLCHLYAKCVIRSIGQEGCYSDIYCFASIWPGQTWASTYC